MMMMLNETKWNEMKRDKSIELKCNVLSVHFQFNWLIQFRWWNSKKKKTKGRTVNANFAGAVKETTTNKSASKYFFFYEGSRMNTNAKRFEWKTDSSINLCATMKLNENQILKKSSSKDSEHLEYMKTLNLKCRFVKSEEK